MIEQASLVLGNGNWAVKSDSLLGYKTIDGKYYPREFTFTRATTGTRVNEAGLVELVPYNLLRYSEQFENAAWSVNTATVTVNTTIAPDGTLTADTITNVSGSLVGQATNILIGQIFTFSIYLKRINGIGAINLIDVNGNLVPITITNEWHKYYVTSTSTSTLGRTYFRVMTTGDSVAAWGAQLVEGTEPLDYLPTTDRLDIARIDYSTGEPALLLEPQRTNLITYSEDYSQSEWTNAPYTKDASITYNSASVAPDGTLGVYQYECTVSGTNSQLGTLKAISSGVAYSNSVYLRRITGSGIVKLRGVNNGEIDVTSELTSSWKRFEITQTSNSTDGRFYINALVSGDVIEVWGAQLEAGSYATSYIPTTTASVTRSRDQCVKTGISSLINSTEGVLYAEINALANDLTFRTISLSSDTNLNRIRILYNITTNNVSYQIRNTSGVLLSDSDTVTDIKDTIKIAIKYKSTDFAVWLNGVEVATSSSAGDFSSDILTNFSFDNGSGSDNFYGNVQNVMVFPTVLSDDELATLTTI